MPSWIAPITWTFKQIPTFTALNTEIRDKLLFFKTLFDDSANLAPPARTTLTLSSNTTGAVTPTQNAHAVDTFSAGGSGDLATLTIAGNIRAGHLLTMSAANVAHVVTVKDGVGNISLLGGDCVLSSTKSFLQLQLIGTTWFELARSLAAPVRGLQLLHEASGNSTAAGGTVVDSFALASSLTIKDSLLVIVKLRSVGGNGVTGSSLYNVTDAVAMGGLSDANANSYTDVYVVANPPNDTKKTNEQGLLFFNASVSSHRTTFLTDWTGNWTFGLRHGGVPAGDTWYWDLVVYKMFGQ